MTAKDVLKSVLTSTQWITTEYLKDLSDADMQVRPVENANNAAWQMAHIIASETHLMAELPGATYPELPQKIKDATTGASAKTNRDGGGLTRAEYVELFNKVRAASIANVDRLNDADLDIRSNGLLKMLAPTLGDLVVLVGNHTTMHSGQFTVIRRLLGKPVLF